jgi:tRNA-binding EMAP/Myf-like protein
MRGAAATARTAWSRRPDPLAPSRLLSRATSTGSGSGVQGAASSVAIPRIFNDSLGHTHFDEIHVRLRDKEGTGAAGIGQLSAALPATALMFRRTPGDYDFAWHCAPAEQFIVNLDADVKVTVTDGSSRVLRAGQVFYVEDTSGLGHWSQAVDGKDRNSVFVPCPKETLLPHLEPAPLQYGHLDLRVGVIRHVERHPEADELFVERIDVGDSDADGGIGGEDAGGGGGGSSEGGDRGGRQIVSGLVPYFPPQALLGRRVVVVCNLPKAKLRGVVSHGMILCASAPSGTPHAAAGAPAKTGVGHSAAKGMAVAFVEPPAGAAPGDRVVVDNRLSASLYGLPLSPNQLKKQKHVVPAFLEQCRTAAQPFPFRAPAAAAAATVAALAEEAGDAPVRYIATVAGIPLMTPGGPCTVAALADAAIH